MFHPKTLNNYRAFYDYCKTQDVKVVDYNFTMTTCQRMFKESHSPAKFMQLYNQDNKCAYCFKTLRLNSIGSSKRDTPHNYGTLDHVVPKSKGCALGYNYSNCLIVCYKCNTRKGNKNVFEYLNQLYDVPKRQSPEITQYSLLTSLYNDIILIFKVFLGSTVK